MWDPGFDHSGAVSARVLGWHRRFTLVSTISWGTGDAPGLCAVLHRGGTSWGRAFTVNPERLEGVLHGLDRREIAYHRRNVWLEIGDGIGVRRQRAWTYVANPDHPRLRADIDPEQQKTLVRQGVGTKGSSLFYLKNTARCLADDGHFHNDARKFLAMLDIDRANGGDCGNP
ncbi:hypothetical protein MNBD_ALPHA09-1551 [hydrothermal vent metagenome]|uniref:glutathione-specific gamma-glutamylcyclotransferase n=1 Tax=hydrothermal vent metagenome TaxID=652676 RepID=A0A3B0TIA2_9ZZZZ